ncbi:MULTISPECIES: hypothetical protein [unclassified Methylophaga]|uniref:LpxL/LpxP family acyltransferase n=2 Tax=Methylophaga TaxID=40222 RepID=UPI000C8F76EF|nr:MULTISPECIES: hypothetical protein [unclassified Methylophaga]MAK66148.1 lipid A biosynthesis acyltransferase [Methylophaga sp.]MAY17344.1 lipid A biosynthesis acyltransferase [Methylophaga sp.]|tara:strand:- start:27765 stop:28703 length:939 start_codon:yes stop_codon:yes gene_type:complete
MTKRHHWSRISESGTVFGMKLLLLIYRLLGRWGFRVVLFPVIAYYYLRNQPARQASQQYLSRVQSCLQAQKSLSSFKHFLMFGETLLDKFLVWMGQITLNDVQFQTDGLFEQAIENKQGGIIIVSHLGNTEVCNALARQQPDLKLTLLVYTRHAEKFNSLMQKVNQQAQVEMYQVTEMSPAFAMLMSERVEAGEFLVIAGDRTPVTGEQRVSEVDFLGASAPMPQGGFILAGLLGCPVFLMFCLKHPDGYHIYLEQFAEKLSWSRRERQLKLDNVVQQYAKCLQHYCLKAPLQWFNFYPFWSAEIDSNRKSE